MKRQKTDSYNHILKYTGLFGGVQMLTILANVVRNKAMAKLLGTQGVGLNSLLYSAQTFASQCTNLGISFGAVPRLSDCYERGDEEQIAYNIQLIRLWSFIAAGLGFVFCLAVSPLLGDLTFTWGHFYRHYAALGLSVAAMAITGGETAILKATRQLGKLARVQTYTALASIAITLLLLYLLSYSGILPSIILIALFSALATIVYSYRRYPLRWHFTRKMLLDGLDILRLGVAFVLAAAFGSGAEMFIRSFLNVDAGLDAVGLYNAGYMIVITYAGMAFSAMESDYFPRLSGISNDIPAVNNMVNKQIEVTLFLLSPMLVAMLMFLPILVPMLFSRAFLSVIGMAQVAVLAMYFKVLTLPVAYITLARKDALAYLCLEAAYYVTLTLAVIVGFRFWGIFGTGLAIVVAHVLEFMTIYCFACLRYSYRSTAAIGGYAGVQLAIGLAAYAVSCYAEGWIYWTTEAALVVASTAYSVYVLHQKTRLWEALKRRFIKSV